MQAKRDVAFVFEIRGGSLARPLERLILERGLKLDLNRLMRSDLRWLTGARGISWTSSLGRELASGLISAGFLNDGAGYLDIQIDRFEQRIELSARPRNFGGHQWYFLCPVTGQMASILWKLPLANQFQSRQAFGGQAAYLSQFVDRKERAQIAKSKLVSTLSETREQEASQFPDKPKWMRWSTYAEYKKRYDGYSTAIDSEFFAKASALLRALER